MGQLYQRGRIYWCALLLTLSCLIAPPAYALDVEDWLRLPPQERAILMRGALDAWAFQEEMSKWSKPPVSVPDQLAAVNACVKDLSMTDEGPRGCRDLHPPPPWSLAGVPNGDDGLGGPLADVPGDRPRREGSQVMIAAIHARGVGADMSLAELRLALGVTEAQFMEGIEVARLSDDLYIAFTAKDRVTLGVSWRGRCEDAERPAG